MFAQKGYRFGLFPDFACDFAVRAVCHDLYEFCHEFPIMDDQLTIFIAMFHGPAIESAQHFEDLLWSQLQAMHAIDSDFLAWDKRVDPDPKNNNFSFSIGGRAMFVIGMHPKASRIAPSGIRPWRSNCMHSLRACGKFETMKQIIRAREMAFQGSINLNAEKLRRTFRGESIFRPGRFRQLAMPFHAQKKDEP